MSIVYILMETCWHAEDTVVAVFSTSDEAWAYAKYLIEKKRYHKEDLWVTDREFNPKGEE